MFRDTEKELKRLEAGLLEEEEPEKQDPSDLELEDWERDLETLLGEDLLDTPDKTTNLLDDPDDFGEETPDIYHNNYYNHYGKGDTQIFRAPHSQSNAQTSEAGQALTDFGAEPEEYVDDPEAEAEPPRENNTPLLITAMCLLAGIIAVLLWWLFRFFL